MMRMHQQRALQRAYFSSRSNQYLNTSVSPARIINGVLDTQTSQLTIQWSDTKCHHFDLRWLRQSCYSPKCIDPITNQTSFDRVSMNSNQSLLADSIEYSLDIKSQQLHIKWPDLGADDDRHESSYSFQFLNQFHPNYLRSMHDHQHLNHHNIYDRQQKEEEKELWSGQQFQLPSFRASNVLKDPKLMLHALYRFGLVRIQDAECSQDMTRALALCCGESMMNTIYGPGLWSTINDSSHQENSSFQDTAATSCALDLHTDCSYLRNPPGLQIFHCYAPAAKGGESIFRDGFHALRHSTSTEDLDQENVTPQMATTLASKALLFQCLDNNRMLQTLEPVIRFRQPRHFETLEDDGLDHIRWNEYDRGGLFDLTTGSRELNEFYQAHLELNQRLNHKDDMFEYTNKQTEMLIIDNHRILHGRKEFQNSNDHTREFIGCYIGRDEYEMKLRHHGII